jgi:pyruvate kinase
MLGPFLLKPPSIKPPTHASTRIPGYLGENKGINFPSYIIEELPTVSAKDHADITFAIEQGVDFLSISCIRNIEDVEEVRMLLGNTKIKLLAKIENKAGLDNFEGILKLADGVVIDRGYLGAELDVEYVTMAQKRMILVVSKRELWRKIRLVYFWKPKSYHKMY